MVFKQWRAVTSETGHATGMPKTDYAIRYSLGSEWVGHVIFSGKHKKFCVRF